MIPDERYELFNELFTAYDAGDFEKRMKGTSYFVAKRQQHGAAGAVRLCRKAVSLLKHIRRDGYKPQTGSKRALPCMIVGEGKVLRLDGVHRAAVLRYLGHDKMNVVVITEEEANSLG